MYWFFFIKFWLGKFFKIVLLFIVNKLIWFIIMFKIIFVLEYYIIIVLLKCILNYLIKFIYFFKIGYFLLNKLIGDEVNKLIRGFILFLNKIYLFENIIFLLYDCNVYWFIYYYLIMILKLNFFYWINWLRFILIYILINVLLWINVCCKKMLVVMD